MGNYICPRKHVQDPNHPADDHLPLPPSGIDRVQISGRKTRSTSLQLRTSSVSSNIRRGAENRSKNEACAFPLRESNTPVLSSNSRRERHGKDDKHAFSATPKDWSVSMNRKDELFHAYKLNCFCYSDLKAATQKFREKNLIGQGGFGDVYKGYIDYSRFAVAVKKLRKNSPQGHHEWLNEMQILSRLNHPNIIKLIGYCSEGEHRILVYEYMTRGGLEAHLLKENTQLNWRRRIKIAAGAARGLAFLHNRTTPIIHRDLKASNVLLDADFNAKLSDFGLARFGPQDDKTHISTRVVGTRGYFDPEYVATGRLTLKTDVYSFGVVLLEILSGRCALKKFSNGAAGELAPWAKPHLSNKAGLHRVIDKKLGRHFPMEEAQKFAEIILQCLRSDPTTRPTMAEVAGFLEQLQQNTGRYNAASGHRTLSTLPDMISSCPWLH